MSLSLLSVNLICVSAASPISFFLFFSKVNERKHFAFFLLVKISLFCVLELPL